LIDLYLHTFVAIIFVLYIWRTYYFITNSV